MHEVHYVQQLPCTDQAAWSVKWCCNSAVLALLILVCKHIQGLILPRRPRRQRPLQKKRRVPKWLRRERADFDWAQLSLIPVLSCGLHSSTYRCAPCIIGVMSCEVDSWVGVLRYEADSVFGWAPAWVLVMLQKQNKKWGFHPRGSVGICCQADMSLDRGVCFSSLRHWYLHGFCLSPYPQA